MFPNLGSDHYLRQGWGVQIWKSRELKICLTSELARFVFAPPHVPPQYINM